MKFLHQRLYTIDVIFVLHWRMYEALYTQCFPNVYGKKPSTRYMGGIRTHNLLLA